MHKYNVERFNLDHTRVKTPSVCVASQKTGTKGDVLSTFDNRFCQPNVDFSPMGCRTGFYATLFGVANEAFIAEKMTVVLEKVAAWKNGIKAKGYHAL